jgi:hypothetical protein
MKELAHVPKPGSSALFILVRRMTPDKVISELSRYGGKILQTSSSQAVSDETLTPRHEPAGLAPFPARWRRNQSLASSATFSSVPGSSNKCVAPGMITSCFSHCSAA